MTNENRKRLVLLVSARENVIASIESARQAIAQLAEAYLVPPRTIRSLTESIATGEVVRGQIEILARNIPR